MKKIQSVYNSSSGHWVGDGFPVRSLFSYDRLGRELSPFLLLDHAGPMEFPPADKPRGVGPHPHRGFETVTMVYAGEVAHRDSTGQGGMIGAGDVQWMTAGAGILHEEMHSEPFTRSGGNLEMVQLWVNLPAEYKFTPPGYQSILNRDIPVVDLAHDAGTLRIIAGTYADRQGPAHTFTSMLVADMKLSPGGVAELAVPEGWTTAVVGLHGTVSINDSNPIRSSQMVLLEPKGQEVVVEANNDALVLILAGEPITEPIVGHGPFVMNTPTEIDQAIRDFNSGLFGSIRH